MKKIRFAVLSLVTLAAFSFFSSSPASAKAKLMDKNILDEQRNRNEQIANYARDHLMTPEEFAIVNQKIHDAEKPVDQMVPIFTNEEDLKKPGTPIFVMIHGHTYDELFTYYEPFFKMYQAKANFFLFRWNNRPRLERIAEIFVGALAQLKEQHPGHPIEVLAYCAGGVISLFSTDLLVKHGNQDFLKDVHINSIAAPINGFGAPAFWTWWGVGIYGYSVLDVGIGANRKMSADLSPYCSEWITTSCDLDVVACKTEGFGMKQGLLPQVAVDNEGEPLPKCGIKNVHRYDDQTHTTIVARATEDVLEKWGRFNRLTQPVDKGM